MQTDGLSLLLQAPPLGPLRFAAPINPVYDSTIQKANKVRFLHSTPFKKSIYPNSQAAWDSLFGKPSWTWAAVWQAAHG
jgi:hypothetical protein